MIKHVQGQNTQEELLVLEPPEPLRQTSCMFMPAAMTAAMTVDVTMLLVTADRGDTRGHDHRGHNHTDRGNDCGHDSPSPRRR